ncbi:MAG: OmpA family protein [Bacteroidota bacterium]|nr:OmpA family protein [Bacteroidota bacterium]
MKKLLLLSIIMLFMAITLNAQEEETEDESGHSFHGGLFFGATTVTAAGGHTSGIAGLDIEYIIQGTEPEFGAGVLFEMVLADEKEYIFGIPVFFHPYDEFKCWAAPALAYSHAKEEEPTDDDKFDAVSHSSYNFLLRIGAGYDFRIQNFTITPTLCGDLVESKFVFVYGITIGYLF